MSRPAPTPNRAEYRRGSFSKCTGELARCGTEFEISVRPAEPVTREAYCPTCGLVRGRERLAGVVTPQPQPIWE